MLARLRAWWDRRRGHGVRRALPRRARTTRTRVSASRAVRCRRACPVRSRSTSRTTATPVPSAVPRGSSLQSRGDSAARRPGRRARRADRDPVRQRRPDAHADDVRRAAEWVAERIRRAGGTVEIVERGGRPLVIGEVQASTARARRPFSCTRISTCSRPIRSSSGTPTRGRSWSGTAASSPAASPTTRGTLFMLLKATELLAAAGELPVNVRFAIDAEEEIGGHSVVDWVAGGHRPGRRGTRLRRRLRDGDAAVDLHRAAGHLLPATSPSARASATSTRACSAVRRSIAMHALMEILQAVLPGPDGLLPEPLRAGIVAADRRRDRGLGGASVRKRGARVAGCARRGRRGRRGVLPAHDGGAVGRPCNGIEGGSPRLQKTVLPVEAQANVSIRLAPASRPRRSRPSLERLLHEATPEGASLEVELWSTGDPGFVDPAAPAVRIAQDAFEHVLGHATGADALRWLDPARRRARRARRADDRDGVHATELERPLAERANPRRRTAATD